MSRNFLFKSLTIESEKKKLYVQRSNDWTVYVQLLENFTVHIQWFEGATVCFQLSTGWTVGDQLFCYRPGTKQGHAGTKQ